MFPPRLVGIVALGITEARCKYCRERILWVTTASEPGKPSRTLPFTYPRPFPVRVETNAAGIQFEYWPRESLHLLTCRRQPTTTTNTDTKSFPRVGPLKAGGVDRQDLPRTSRTGGATAAERTNTYER